ncbi:MAG: hypothetical protein JO069_00555, partial [Verrucomicrobia bacterium]|nr:hypothetical protein [Verrucomicrobiota bacterium]
VNVRLDALLFEAACVLLLVIKPLAVLHYRIDSDEPQHLHVVWNWLHVGVGYRDFFDNHAPLFHLLSVPLLSLFGEHARTLLAMRSVLLLVYAASLLAAGTLARTFTTSRVAWWASLVLGVFPPFFLTGTEWRPDGLWALAFLGCLNLLVRSDWRPGRIFCPFLVLGLGFCISLKTVLMIVVLVQAFVILYLASHRDARPALSVVLRSAAAASFGLALPPAILALYLATQHALPAAWECLVSHNLLPEPNALPRMLARTADWLLALAVPVTAIVLAWRRPRSPAGRRGIFLALIAVLFLVTLRCYWRSITAEDYLPLHVLLVPLALSAAVYAGQKMGGAQTARCVPWFAFAVCMLLSAVHGRLWENHTTRKLNLVADALRLAPPGAYVMDAKGETIFHRRPTRLILEHLTILRLRHHLLVDDIAEQLVNKRVAVVSNFKLTARAAVFVNSEYLPVAWRLQVLGKALQPIPEGDQTAYEFDVKVPERYVFLSQEGVVTGELDGAPLTGAAFLSTEHHRFRCRRHSSGPLVLFWAHAQEAGYTPFITLPPDPRLRED